MDESSWETSRGEEKGVMLVPFLRHISGCIIAIEPNWKGHNAVALAGPSPAIAHTRISPSPRHSGSMFYILYPWNAAQFVSLVALSTLNLISSCLLSFVGQVLAAG